MLDFIKKEVFLDNCEETLKEIIEDCSADKWYSFNKKYR